MLMKRARSSPKKGQCQSQTTTLDDGSSSPRPDHNSNTSFKTPKPNPFFHVPCLILGITPKCVLDCDSIRSPTSTLDFKTCSNLGTTSLGFLKPNHHHKCCWECTSGSKVGLGIVDSLDEGDHHGDRKAVKLSSSNGKNILFGLQIRNKNPPDLISPKVVPPRPQSPISSLLNNNNNNDNPVVLPFTPRPMKSCRGSKTEVLFEIGDDVSEPNDDNPCTKTHTQTQSSFSVDSTGSPASFGTIDDKRTYCMVNESAEHQILHSDNKSRPLPLSVSAGIELSEDYTCVITRGPNPKTTHIYGDCILEGHHTATTTTTTRTTGPSAMQQTNGTTPRLENPPLSPLENFLSFCHFCNKKLEEGTDIYMYRGEKAFCSFDCRSEEILIKEGKANVVSGHGEDGEA